MSEVFGRVGDDADGPTWVDGRTDVTDVERIGDKSFVTLTTTTSIRFCVPNSAGNSTGLLKVKALSALQWMFR